MGQAGADPELLGTLPLAETQHERRAAYRRLGRSVVRSPQSRLRLRRLAWIAALSTLLGFSLVLLMMAAWRFLKGDAWQIVLQQVALGIFAAAPPLALVAGIVNYAWHRSRQAWMLRRLIRRVGQRLPDEVAEIGWSTDRLLVIGGGAAHPVPWPAVRNWVEDAGSMVLILHPFRVVMIALARVEPAALSSLGGTLEAAGVQRGVSPVAGADHVANVFT